MVKLLAPTVPEMVALPVRPKLPVATIAAAGPLLMIRPPLIVEVASV